MKCEKCGNNKAWTQTDQNNGLIGYWTCLECLKEESLNQDSEKKITLTVQADGQIKIEYPNDFTFMEMVGLLEASKAILLNGYVNPLEKTIYHSSSTGSGDIR